MKTYNFLVHCTQGHFSGADILNCNTIIIIDSFPGSKIMMRFICYLKNTSSLQQVFHRKICTYKFLQITCYFGTTILKASCNKSLLLTFCFKMPSSILEKCLPRKLSTIFCCSIYLTMACSAVNNNKCHFNILFPQCC